jgi:flavin reductase (DIM6/NTAB) family NADH-FMN oxidoreductase RutF
VDSSGAHNLAPFSYFNAVSSDPPYVVFAPNAPNATRTKDTYRNLLEVPEFVANFTSVADAEAMNASSKDYPRGVDEFEACGIAAAPSRLVRPRRVAIAKAALECRVFQIVNLPKTPDGRQNNVVIGEVVGIHIADEVIVDGRVDEALLAPLSRLGYMNYGVLGRIFAMDRPA